jgi:hypothetical protein
LNVARGANNSTVARLASLAECDETRLDLHHGGRCRAT